MPTYEFSCAACGAHVEQRAGYDVSVVPCPNCGLPAARCSVYAVNFCGFARTPLDQRTYYQEFKDFQEAGAELQHAHSRQEEAAGRELPSPSLARIAKRKARALIAAGVKDSEDYKSRLKH